MKKIASLLLACLLVAVLAACGGTAAPASSTAPVETSAADSSAPASTETSGEPLLIGFAINALDETQTPVADTFTTYCEEQGHSVNLTNAEGKVDKQLADIESLIALQCDVIVIQAVDSGGLSNAVQQCDAAGIPVLDTGFGIAEPCDLHMLYDSFAMCKPQADYLKTWMDENPDETLKIGYIWGAQGTQSVQDQYDGFYNTLADDAAYEGRWEILGEKVCNWSATETMAVMEDWLQAYPDMNCIVAMSDAMAIAATQVLNAAGEDPADWVVVGKDGSGDAVAAIQEGTMNATVQIPFLDNAKVIAQYAIDLGSGALVTEKGENRTFDTYILITPENVDEFAA